MEKHWFTLYPDTFLWVKREEGLVYNTLNNLSYFFKITGRVEILCNELSALENLYTSSISEEDMMDQEVQQWVRSVINIKGGFLTPITENEVNPVSLKPVLKLQEKTEVLVWEHERGAGGDLLKTIHELTFYINNSDGYGSDRYYRQTTYPLKKCGQLDMEKTLMFIRYCRNPKLTHVNLVGNIFSYPEYNKLLDGLSELCIPYTIHITLQDFFQNIKQINEIQWADYNKFNILIDSLPDRIPPLQDIRAKIQVNALIFSESDYRLVSEKFDNIPIYCDVLIIPIYDGKNLDFFESHVFADKEELGNIVLTKREIFVRQALNIHNYGKLTVMSDGTVYANVNHELLGTIDDTVYSLVYKEFTERRSWLQIRDQAPCTECVYQWLCPSPSNYETVIGKSNLCHIF